MVHWNCQCDTVTMCVCIVKKKGEAMPWKKNIWSFAHMAISLKYIFLGVFSYIKVWDKSFV